MASTLGLLPQFDGSAADWDVFAEQLIFYCIANGIEDADKKRAILLSTCGTATYKLSKILVAPADLTGKSFDELVHAVGQRTLYSETIDHHVPFPVQHQRSPSWRVHHSIRHTPTTPRLGVPVRIWRLRQGDDQGPIGLWSV